MIGIAATLGFAAGLAVGFATAEVRALAVARRVYPAFWRSGASLEEASPSSKVFTRHESRDTKHGF